MRNEASSTESAGKEDEARAKRLLVDRDTIRLPFLEGIGNLAHQIGDWTTTRPPAPTPSGDARRVHKCVHAAGRYS